MSSYSSSRTPLWPLIYGLVIVGFSVFLLAVRAGISIFVIFMIIGLGLIMFWAFYKAMTKQKSDMKLLTKEPCSCAICNHDKASFCLEQKCPCCIVVKGENTIGHTNSPLQ